MFLYSLLAPSKTMPLHAAGSQRRFGQVRRDVKRLRGVLHHSLNWVHTGDVGFIGVMYRYI